jgi:hypothetical protein
LLLLVISQDFRQLGIDIFLEIRDLLLLVIRKVEPLLNERRQDLARPWWATGRTETATWTTSTTAWSSRTAAWSSRTATTWTTLCGEGSGLLGEEGCQLLLRENTILIRVCSVEERLQPRIGHFVLGQFTIHILVECHHSSDHLLNGRALPTAWPTLIAFGTLATFPALSAIGWLGHRE